MPENDIDLAENLRAIAQSEREAAAAYHRQAKAERESAQKFRDAAEAALKEARAIQEGNQS